MKILVMTPEFMARNLERLRIEAGAQWATGNDEYARYLETQIKCFEAARDAMTGVDTTNAINAYCDSLVARVTPTTKHHLEQFLGVLLAHINGSNSEHVSMQICHVNETPGRE